MSKQEPIIRDEYLHLLDEAHRQAEAGLLKKSYQTLERIIARVSLRSVGVHVDPLEIPRKNKEEGYRWD